MGDCRPGETRVLPKKILKRSSFGAVAPDPTRPVRFLISRRRAVKENNSVISVDEMETLAEPSSHSPATVYGDLEHLQSFKAELKPDDKSLPKKVR